MEDNKRTWTGIRMEFKQLDTSVTLDELEKNIKINGK
jgi:hypothetical protein